MRVDELIWSKGKILVPELVVKHTIIGSIVDLIPCNYVYFSKTSTTMHVQTVVAIMQGDTNENLRTLDSVISEEWG
jgi:hypothetical protein